MSPVRCLFRYLTEPHFLRYFPIRLFLKKIRYFNRFLFDLGTYLGLWLLRRHRPAKLLSAGCSDCLRSCSRNRSHTCSACRLGLGSLCIDRCLLIYCRIDRHLLIWNVSSLNRHLLNRPVLLSGNSAILGSAEICPGRNIRGRIDRSSRIGLLLIDKTA